MWKVLWYRSNGKKLQESRETSQEENVFHINIWCSSKTFQGKLLRKVSRKFYIGTFEKDATKPVNKGMAQFKNKPQEGKGTKDKWHEANKFNNIKFQPDTKQRRLINSQEPHTVQFQNKEERAETGAQDKTNYDIAAWANRFERKVVTRQKKVRLKIDLWIWVKGKPKLCLCWWLKVCYPELHSVWQQRAEDAGIWRIVRF